MDSYLQAYEKLKNDYQKIVNNTETLNHYSPIKKVRVLDSIHGTPAITLTKMEGETLDGYKVDKTILVNDENNTTDDEVILENKNNTILEDYHNIGLTRLRCGLMTCVALEEAKNLLNIEASKVGFIGNGRTNIQNCDCIHRLFHIDNFVIRGSANNRGKHLEEFKKISKNVTVDESDDFKLLNECDAIISCTSTCDPKDQISTSQLNKPKIFIALDTGYLLNETFRKECEAFSDDVPQLNAYYDEEFIFDKQKIQLKQLKKDKTITKDRICVYMFGIAFADAEVAEMMHEHQLKQSDID